MKSIASVIKLKPNVFMESIDSKDACLSVPIPLEHQKYSKFFFFNKPVRLMVMDCWFMIMGTFTKLIKVQF